MKRLIVPGVGGSEAQHWQSWLQHVLPDSERVEQQNWHQPVLQQWAAQLTKVVQQQNKPVQIVAHSFGCLTSVAALKQHPELADQVDSLILVAPANPERFSATGLRQSGQASIAQLLPNTFAGSTLPVPSLLIASQTDPWLDFEAAKILASQWQSRLVALGNAGHINVAAGFGTWPQLLPYLDLLTSGSARSPLAPVRQPLNRSARMRDLPTTQHFRFSHSF